MTTPVTDGGAIYLAHLLAEIEANDVPLSDHARIMAAWMLSISVADGRTPWAAVIEDVSLSDGTSTTIHVVVRSCSGLRPELPLQRQGWMRDEGLQIFALTEIASEALDTTQRVGDLLAMACAAIASESPEGSLTLRATDLNGVVLEAEISDEGALSGKL